jgi:hypothetical protein
MNVAIGVLLAVPPSYLAVTVVSRVGLPFRRVIHKSRHVLLQLVERLTVDVHHMPGIELTGSDVAAQAGVGSKVLEGVIDVHPPQTRGYNRGATTRRAQLI